MKTPCTYEGMEDDPTCEINNKKSIIAKDVGKLMISCTLTGYLAGVLSAFGFIFWLVN